MSASAAAVVRWGDGALATVVGHLARHEQGVVRLQPQLVRRVGSGLRRETSSDAGAVAIHQEADGSTDVDVRLVTRLEPPPAEVVARLGTVLTDAIGALTRSPVRVTVTVTDVVP